jgi:hypothetical protein
MRTVIAAGHLCCGASLVLALSACAAPTLKEGVPLVVTDRVIAPHESHEVCAKLAPGDRVDYYYKAKSPVAFNIHYHEGKVIVMPITRDNSTSDAGIFVPRFAQDYCLMWESGADGAFLDYRVTLTRAPRNGPR